MKRLMLLAGAAVMAMSANAYAQEGDAGDEISEAVDHQQPHRRKVPEQAAAEPAAESVFAREAEVE